MRNHLVAVLAVSLAGASCMRVEKNDPIPSTPPASDAAVTVAAEPSRSADGHEAVAEAQEPVSPGAILLATCLLAGALAAEHGCEHHLIDSICPPGTTVERTVVDLWDRRQSVTIRIHCNDVKWLACGGSGVAGGELLKHMCASFL